ncbi:MAG: hypothetical protein JWP40_4776 [Blastococcus sp.]|nr:hypothetical protein [Blastococcus sp.]
MVDIVVHFETECIELSTCKSEFRKLRDHSLARRCSSVASFVRSVEILGWADAFRMILDGITFRLWPDRCVVTIPFTTLDKCTGLKFHESFLYHSRLRDDREKQIHRALWDLLEQDFEARDEEYERRAGLQLEGGCANNRTVFPTVVVDFPHPAFRLPITTNQLEVELDVDGELLVTPIRGYEEIWPTQLCWKLFVTPTSWLELDCLRFTVRLSTSYRSTDDYRYRARRNVAAQWYKRDREDLEEYVDEVVVKRVKV